MLSQITSKIYIIITDYYDLSVDFLCGLDFIHINKIKVFF